MIGDVVAVVGWILFLIGAGLVVAVLIARWWVRWR